MRLLIQRVQWARVNIAEKTVARIGPGLLVFVGVGKDDREADARRCSRKVAGLRIFSDAGGKMNIDIRQSRGSILSVSQFTLYADIRHGNRPGFDQAAPPELAERVWQLFNADLRQHGMSVCEGVFAADMDVELCNDGPVTIGYDSRRSEGE